MAETSRARFTITLGRSGQVVKREGHLSYTDSRPIAGSKRSIRDRLGDNVDNSLLRGSQLNNKRQRGDGNISTFRANDIDDMPISKDDLRFKLMRKNMSRLPKRDADRRTGDLREKLSRTVRPSPRSVDPRQRVSVTKETRILGRLPSTRSADDLPQMESSRNSYSVWNMDHLRCRSPDEILGSSRGCSPQRNMEGLQRRPVNTTFNDVRSVPYMMSRGVPDTSMALKTATFVTKPTLSARPAAAVAPVPSQIPHSSGVLHKTSYMVDEQQTVERVLHSLGLEKYAILFKAEEVDMTALKQMGDNDLKELGIPMGPRKKILLALMPRSKRHP